ncbi:MAG: S1C family serine protease [Puniceicoccales bacterium]|jgi:S1-C subfamily serine protease|nr:S1C family serine protease [Puniceicoccales bacterium]
MVPLKKARIAVLALMFLLPFSPFAFSGNWEEQRVIDRSNEFENRMANLFNGRRESVVRVSGYFQREDGTMGVRTGSGFFVREDGCVVTTAGAVEGAGEILVEYGSRVYRAAVLGVDLPTNLAVLRPLAEEQGSFSHFSLGDGQPLPEPTTPLLGITCEAGLDPSPCLGVVCGHHICYGTHYFPTTYLRTSLPSNAGAPGSPVFDLRGGFVGILMASIPQVNGSFLLPARAVRRILCDLLIGGTTQYAYVGLGTRLSRDENGECVVRVDRVDPESPAAAAKITVGDRILAIDDQPILGVAELHDLLFFATPNGSLSLRLLRGSETLRVLVRTTSRQF